MDLRIGRKKLTFEGSVEVMKFFKWKIWTATVAACLAPIVLGLAFWNKLPQTMAIHFNIHNQPDGYASKVFVVFGLPMLMVALQTVCCFINDINAARYGERKKLELVTKWIIPVMSMLLYVVTLGYAMGRNMDIRRIVCVIVGGVLIVIGNYLPKLDYVKQYDLDTDKARKINRFIGFTTVLMGVLMLVSVFLPSVASVIVLILLVPYAILNVIYGIYVGKK